MAPRMPTTCLEYYPEIGSPVNEDSMDTVEEDIEPSLDELLAEMDVYEAAVKFGWDNIEERLQEPGSQLVFRDERSRNTVLHCAFLFRAPDECISRMMMDYLKEGEENLANYIGLNYLHILCVRSTLPYIEEFLNKVDVDIDAQVHVQSRMAYAGYTALHFAVGSGKLDVVACLLKHNASIRVQDANGRTPVHSACSFSRNVDMIDLLLEHDRAYANVVDKYSLTHFMAACMSSNPLFARQYLMVAYHQYGISPTTLVTEKCYVYPYPGYTPLHFAAEFGRLETVKMLLTYGALCCASSANNETPSMLAFKSSHTEVCDVLTQYCENYAQQVAADSNTLDAKFPSDNSNNQSLPDTTYTRMSACMSPICTSIPDYPYNCNDTMQTYKLMGCEDYGIYLYDD